MNYFLDTEFYEYKKQPTICGMKVGKPINTIELISIGIVSEGYGRGECNYIRSDEGSPKPALKSREYYAICKDFDLKAAWNSFQLETELRNTGMTKVTVKKYWLRENVLKPIYKELHDKECLYSRQALHRANVYIKEPEFKFTYKTLKRLINKYGKTKEQVAKEITNFIYSPLLPTPETINLSSWKGTAVELDAALKRNPPKFYAYYNSYDWVVFCWLFGRMIDLPNGFPMYCIDLKQTSDEVYAKNAKAFKDAGTEGCFLNKLSEHPAYPTQTNAHNALDDAIFNKRLHTFLEKTCPVN